MNRIEQYYEDLPPTGKLRELCLEEYFDHQPIVFKLFENDSEAGEMLCQSIISGLKSGKSKEEVTAWCDEAISVFPSDRKKAMKILDLKRMECRASIYDNMPASLRGTPVTDFIKNQLEKQEAVNHRPPGTFDSILNMPIEEFLKIIQILVLYERKVHEEKIFPADFALQRKMNENVSFYLTEIVRGNRVIDPDTNEICFIKPIGEIMNAEMEARWKIRLNMLRTHIESMIGDLFKV